MYSFSIRSAAPAAPAGEGAHFTLSARAAQLLAWLAAAKREAAAIGLLLYAASAALTPATAAPRAVAASPNAGGETILVFGDSLSAGFGIDEQSGWVALLRERLAKQGYAQWQVVNASLSGETTAGGLRRLPPLLARHKPDIVVLELGGNDGLRALPLATLRTNLREMVEQSRAAGARVVLVGIRLPPNYGPAYTRTFEGIYPELARQMKLPLVPFLLEGVAGEESLMQPDGIHAAAAAQSRLLDNVWPHLKPLLSAARAHR
jgi:acyl-CoA thioesterase-1